MGVIRTNLRPSEGIMVFKNPLTPFGDRKTQICSNFFTLLRPLRRVFHMYMKTSEFPLTVLLMVKRNPANFGAWDALEKSR